MAVSGIDSLFGSQELTEIERLRREREAKNTLAQWGGGTDTVNLSDEGKRLAAEMQARKAREQEDRNQDEAAGQNRFAQPATGVSQGEEDGKEGAAEAAEGTGSKGNAGGGSSSSQVEQIKKQIEQLEAKMQRVAASAMPENAKESAISSYQAQIAELQAQLQKAAQG